MSDEKGGLETRARAIGAPMRDMMAGNPPGLALSDDQASKLFNLMAEGQGEADSRQLREDFLATRWERYEDIGDALNALAEIHPENRPAVARMMRDEINEGSGELEPILDTLRSVHRDTLREMGRAPIDMQGKASVERKKDGSLFLKARATTGAVLSIPFIAVSEIGKVAARIVGIWANVCTTGDPDKQSTLSTIISAFTGVLPAAGAAVDKVGTGVVGTLLQVDLSEVEKKAKAAPKKAKSSGPSARDIERQKAKEDNKRFAVGTDGQGGDWVLGDNAFEDEKGDGGFVR